MKCYSFIIHIWQINILRMLSCNRGTTLLQMQTTVWLFFFSPSLGIKTLWQFVTKKTFYRWNTRLTIFLGISKLKLDEWKKPCRHANCGHNLENTVRILHIPLLSEAFCPVFCIIELYAKPWRKPAAARGFVKATLAASSGTPAKRNAGLRLNLQKPQCFSLLALA